MLTGGSLFGAGPPSVLTILEMASPDMTGRLPCCACRTPSAVGVEDCVRACCSPPWLGVDAPDCDIRATPPAWSCRSSVRDRPCAGLNADDGAAGGGEMDARLLMAGSEATDFGAWMDASSPGRAVSAWGTGSTEGSGGSAFGSTWAVGAWMDSASPASGGAVLRGEEAAGGGTVGLGGRR